VFKFKNLFFSKLKEEEGWKDQEGKRSMRLFCPLGAYCSLLLLGFLPPSFLSLRRIRMFPKRYAPSVS